MPSATRSNTFVSGSTILSAEVNEDLDDLFALVNDELIHADGTNAFTTVPSGPATDPSTDNQLARKAYVDKRGGGVVSRKTKHGSGVDATLLSSRAADTEGQIASFDTTVSEVADHWYRATLYCPMLATNRSAYDILGIGQATRVGLKIKRDGTEIQRGWVAHDTDDDGLALTVVVEYKATATASKDWTVWGWHSSNEGNAAIRYQAAATYPMTFTVEDIGVDV